jgi:hypothetical protein
LGAVPLKARDLVLLRRFVVLYAIESFARDPTHNADGTIHHRELDATRVIFWKLIKSHQCLHGLPSLLFARSITAAIELCPVQFGFHRAL